MSSMESSELEDINYDDDEQRARLVKELFDLYWEEPKRKPGPSAARVAPALPQNASPKQQEERARAVDAKKALYGFRYDANVPGAPMLVSPHTLPWGELPSQQWLRNIVDALLKVSVAQDESSQSNNATAELQILGKSRRAAVCYMISHPVKVRAVGGCKYRCSKVQRLQAVELFSLLLNLHASTATRPQSMK